MHCTHPKKAFHQSNHSSVEMPELNYHKVVAQLSGMEDLLSSLAKHGVGLTLLHGHSDKFMFTKFPEGFVSVIANGITTFRKEKEVMDDKTFVPNVWRSISGKLHVAGGRWQVATLSLVQNNTLWMWFKLYSFYKVLLFIAGHSTHCCRRLLIQRKLR